MADDRTKRGPRDRDRIDIDEDYELRYWTKELGVDEQTLRNTIKTVGPRVEDVRREIGRNLARGEETRGRPS